MSEETNIWPKKITVDKRIVQILSEQTYENFPNAVKEIITNSYDADATKVVIELDLAHERLVVADNGWGMSEEEFNFYLRIAGRRRKKTLKTQSGRSIIGQFGVGFLSVFPFFQTFSIRTKKKNSNKVTYATIPCYEYFSDRMLDITDIKIQGGVRLENDRFKESFTEITLSGFTEICQNFLYPQQIIKSRRISINKLSGVEKLIWKLEEDLPLDYSNDYFNKYTLEYSPNLPFYVTFNNEPLLRRVHGETILEESNKINTIGSIKFHYFICTDRKSITPHEARHLKIRNLNAGVGDRTAFGLGTDVGGARSRLHWLTGEIHIIEGLNEIITVSRNAFNFSADYEELKEFFIKKLAFYSTEMEKEAEFEKFINQSKEETKIKDLTFLNPTVVARKVNEMQKYVELEKHPLNTQATSVTTTTRTRSPIPDLLFEKRISIHDTNYLLVLDKWEYRGNTFPALKISGSDLVVNSNYPLFTGKKFTDIFLKTHLLMLQYLKESVIDQETYNKFSKDILNLFNDYTK